MILDILDHFQNRTVQIIFVLVFVAVSFARWYTGKPKNLPPGSAGIPLFGFLPFADLQIYKTINKCAEKYGNFFHLYLGPHLVIFLNDFKTLKATFGLQGPLFTGRTFVPLLAEKEEDNVGIIMSTGDVWHQHRRFILRNLRDNGMGRPTIEPVVMTEIRYFLKEVESGCEKAVDIKDMLSRSLLSTVNYFVTGVHLDHNHPAIAKLSNLLVEFNELSPFIILRFYLPWLNYIPGFHLTFAKKFQVVENIMGTVNSLINCGNDKISEKDAYVNRYVEEMNARAQTNNGEQVFTEKGLQHTSRDLFEAGSNTTSTFLFWCLLYVTYHSDLQERIQAEIDRSIGQDREPTYNDRINTPLTEATILETHRVVSMASIFSRSTTQDVTLFGYDIPKDTMVFCNTWAIHHDPLLWGDPDNFRPERFIGPNGRAAKPEYLIPFGYGKRLCLGEPLANVEIYLYFTCLLQRFRFLPTNGKKPSLEVVSKFIRFPKEKLLRVEKRIHVA